MAIERTRGIVLRRTNYGEADRIVRFITPQGQRSVVAKGVRREKSKLAGGIELFAISDIVVQSGKSDLGVLTSARLVQFYRHILEDYDRLAFGYDAIKLVAKTSESVDEPQWYGVLSEVYMALDVVTIPLDLVRTWFYVQYAELTGYELSLTHDVDGAPLQVDKKYRYDVAERGLRLSDQGEISADHIKYLRVIATKPIKTVVQIGGTGAILETCWRIAYQHAAV